MHSASDILELCGITLGTAAEMQKLRKIGVGGKKSLFLSGLHACSHAYSLFCPESPELIFVLYFPVNFLLRVLYLLLTLRLKKFMPEILIFPSTLCLCVVMDVPSTRKWVFLGNGGRPAMVTSALLHLLHMS